MINQLRDRISDVAAAQLAVPEIMDRAFSTSQEGVSLPDDVSRPNDVSEEHVSVGDQHTTAWLHVPEDFIAGDGCAVVAHGRGKGPFEALPVIIARKRAGMATLAITLADHEGGPETESGIPMYGTDGSPVVRAGIDYAKEHISGTIDLVGISMGMSEELGAALALDEEELEAIRSITGIAGVYDIKSNIHAQTILGLKQRLGRKNAVLDPNATDPVARAGRRIGESATKQIGAALNFNWDSANYLKRTADGELVGIPKLVISSEDDDVAPHRHSVLFASNDPSNTDFIAFNGYGHVKQWNSAPGPFIDKMATYYERLRANS